MDRGKTHKSNCADTDKEIDRITRVNKVKCRQVVRPTEKLRGRQLQADTETWTIAHKGWRLTEKHGSGRKTL